MSELSEYTNPLLSTNCPDPAVIRLLDGSGYALVASSDQASRADNSSVFPLYFSKGGPHQELEVSSNISLPISRPGPLEPGQPYLQSGQPACLGPGQVLGPGAPRCGGNLPPLLHCRGQSGQTQLWRRHSLLGGSFRGVLGTGGPVGLFRPGELCREMLQDLGEPLITAPDSIAGCLDPHHFRDPVSQKSYLLWKQDAPLRKETLCDVSRGEALTFIVLPLFLIFS